MKATDLRITPAMVGQLARKGVKRNPKATPAARKTATKTLARKGVKRNPSASSDAARAAKLYERFTGHATDKPQRITVPDLPKSVACIGTCDGLLYTTVRDGKVERYIHRFRVKDKPLFCVSPDGKQLLLVGGAYDFTERGIVDASDTKNR